MIARWRGPRDGTGVVASHYLTPWPAPGHTRSHMFQQQLISCMVWWWRIS